MRAAIYARFSSENQRPGSIEDQVAACHRMARVRDLTVPEEHVYVDRAQSGANRNRPGLVALLKAAGEELFGAVLLDDLSRLARDNQLMLGLMAEFQFYGVRVVSVADGLDSGDEEAMLAIQLRSVFNELFLTDLRQKTLRGQKGQKARGFFVGEVTFGYRSRPVGELRLDRRGKRRPEGYRMDIEPREAGVAVRIFEAYAEGESMTDIVRRLNREGVPGPRRATKKGWSLWTVRGVLTNPKYVGRWIWNKTGTRIDPRTGGRRRFSKPESEWVVVEDEALRIVPQTLWDRVHQARRR